ncbi:MAG: hypothetical protein ACK5RG_19900 [Cyclobacteriaceae bacterium]|jgi:hypothetical protein|nr:hypothetical protein [Flammeovirgaceae bacterium]
MKTKLFFTLFLFFAAIACYSQSNEPVKFKIKNTSILPKKVSLISYTPGDNGNGTQAYWILPGGSKEFTFKVGTKLFLANQKEVRTVMSGASIENGKPYLVVKKEDQDKTFTL